MTETQAPKGDSKTTTPKRGPHACACLTGTGQTCKDTTSKAFHQGHDARMSSRLAEAVATGKMTMEAAEKLIREAGGSDLLVGKTRHSAELRKAGGGEAKPKKTAAKKPAGTKASDEQVAAMQSAATGTAQYVGRKVKVVHGSKDYDAVIVRDAANMAVARHRLIGKNCDHSVDDKGLPGDMIKK